MAVGAATLALVSLLGQIDPFQRVSDWWTGGGETTRMQSVDERPEHIDALHGENLLASLRAIPRPGSQAHRVVVFGNSQQYTASLPRGAHPGGEKAQMASALLEERVRERMAVRSLGSQATELALYNAAAPNQTAPEALWQALYWFEVSPDKPAAILLQLSFDTFRKTGIRAGYQTLLDEPQFLAAMESHLAATRPLYAADWLDAQQERTSRLAEVGTAAQAQPWSSERALRRAMERVHLFAEREKLKASFLGLLYVARVHLLGISPTSRRHITGKPIEQSFAALEDLIKVAQRAGARVFAYNAPVNPAVDMFYPDEYDGYVVRLRALCATHDVSFADLAQAVPADRWGYWIDGPDPIHFDAQAHHLVADMLDREFGTALASLANR